MTSRLKFKGGAFGLVGGYGEDRAARSNCRAVIEGGEDVLWLWFTSLTVQDGNSEETYKIDICGYNHGQDDAT